MSEAKFEKVISEDTIEERKHLKAQLIDFLHKSKLAEENFEKFVSTETKEKPLKKKYKPGVDILQNDDDFLRSIFGVLQGRIFSF